MRWLIPLIALCGCSAGGGSSRGGQMTIDTLANGTVRVRNTGAGAWSPAETWRIVEDLRIGSDDSGDPAMFSQIAAIGAGPAGQIVIADGASQEIRIFDASGVHIRTLGRKGSGPGEFAGISGITWDAGDNMWVADPGNARYSRYDGRGEHLGDVRMGTPGAVLPWLGSVSIDGFLYDAAARAVGNQLGFRYYRMDRTTGAVIDSFPPMTWMPPDRDVPAAFFRLLPRLTFRLDPVGNTWFGITDDYRLIERTLDGDTVRIVELDTPSVSLTDAERDSIIRQMEQESEPTGDFGRRDIPTAKPAFDRIHFDDAGHVIIEPNTRPDRAGRVFDVFDHDGRYLGRVESDIRFVTFPPLPVFVRGYVYGVTTDEAGAQVVVRARIVAAAGS